MGDPIYKILTAEQWAEFERTSRFDGAPVDLADGYVHLSTAGQVRETAARHFAGMDGLMLVAIDESKLGDSLVYEVSRGGALFPHCYRPLPFDAVTDARPLPLGDDGVHLFPAGMDSPS
jgi:uncharacterized protein (DUF952 family)